MNITDNEKRETYKKYKAGQDEIANINEGIRELQAGMQKASEPMIPRYEKMITDKQLELKAIEISTTSYYDRLVVLNSPDTEEEVEFPYQNQKRSSLDDETKVSIIKKYGMDKYKSMPV